MSYSPCADFRQLACVLEKQKPSRPVLFEFMIDESYIRHFAGEGYRPGDTGNHYDELLCSRILGYANAGYDFACMHGSLFHFPAKTRDRQQTVSLNEGAVITDRESFDRYPWPNPEDYSTAALESAAQTLPEGMKLIICLPCGVLENAIALAGYENLCIMAYENPKLLGDIFEQIGSRLVRYLRPMLEYPFVGAVMCNDDWGFRTQTMLSPDMMRRYVFPWHQQMAADAHEKGKYALLHSCGNYDTIIDDVINVMKFDGRHSYEDNIEPVEKAYPRLSGRIAILGGIDMDYLARSPISEITARCRNMLELASDGGGYALGSGNSIPPYVPLDNFKAMLRVALKSR